MHEETHKYFRERELILLGHFGMSESTLPLTTNLLNAEKFGSCGRSTNGVQVGVLINDEYNDSKVLHFKEKNNNTGEVSDYSGVLYTMQKPLSCTKQCGLPNPEFSKL